MLTEVLPRAGRGTGEADAGSRAVEWSEAVERLTRGGWFWLTTVRPDGAPHVRPVFALWSQSAMFIASKDSARKSRNLAADGHCALSTDAGDLHLVVEGVARRVPDAETLARVSQAYETIYGWPTTVSGDRLDAEYGAPTSGGPPYDVYEIRPTKAFGFPTGDGSFEPTRFTFEELGRERAARGG